MTEYSIFDLLLWANAVAAIWCVLTAKPCQFLLTSNLAIIARSFANISRFGQPFSQAHMPASLFADSNMQIAAHLITMATVIAAVLLVWPSRSRQVQVAKTMPPVPRVMLFFLVAYVVFLALTTRNIMTTPYASEDSYIVDHSFAGGIAALVFSVLLYEVQRRVILKQLTPLKGLGTYLLMLFLVLYSKGSTGLASGLFVVAAITVFRNEEKVAKRILMTFGSIGMIIILTSVTREIRSHVSSDGTAESLGSYVDSMKSVEGDIHKTSEGLEGRFNGSQYATHMLACIDIYEGGVSREWRSFLAPIENTFKPSFLLKPLGLERPIDATWELGAYYSHGGGIFVLGEFYWNGGYLCVLVGWLMIAGFCRFCDLRYRSSAPWLMMTANFGPGILMGVGYGFMQIGRHAINGLICLGIGRLWMAAFYRSNPRPHESSARESRDLRPL